MNVILVALIALLSNLLLGIMRTRHARYSFRWFLLIHLSILWIWPLRIMLEVPLKFVPLFILTALLGQWIGARLARYVKRD